MKASDNARFYSQTLILGIKHVSWCRSFKIELIQDLLCYLPESLVEGTGITTSSPIFSMGPNQHHNDAFSELPTETVHITMSFSQGLEATLSWLLAYSPASGVCNRKRDMGMRLETKRSRVIR